METIKLGASGQDIDKSVDKANYTTYDTIPMLDITKWIRIFAYQNQVGVVNDLDISNIWYYGGNDAGSYKIFCLHQNIAIVPIRTHSIVLKFRVVYKNDSLVDVNYIDVLIAAGNIRGDIYLKRATNMLFTEFDNFILQPNAIIPKGYDFIEYTPNLSLYDLLASGAPSSLDEKKPNIYEGLSLEEAIKLSKNEKSI